MTDVNPALPLTAEAIALLDLMDRSDLFLSIKEASTGRYVYVNERMAELLGRSPASVQGCLDSELMDASQWPPLRAADQTALAQRAPQWSEHRLERDGQRREFRVTRIVLPSSGGAPQFMVSAWTELTANRQREAQLQQVLHQLEQQQLATEALRRETQDQSLRDGVTGLYQRIHFDDQLRREIDLSSREHREFALVSIAIDPPKDASHAVGSEAHSRVLEALGRLLRSNTRAMDASCRLAQDRFAVLLSGVGLATAHSRMEGLRRQCATQIVVLDGRDLGFTVSMGVASFPHTAHTEEELVAAADAALAEAQRRGGNHVTLASIRFDAS
jgi:diguanylate cyclase (GGDEF)-like protein/PAS domain S-box-containing protein